MHYSSEANEIYSAREGRKTELTADGTDRSREKPAHPGFPGKGVIKQYLLLYLVDLIVTFLWPTVYMFDVL